MQSNVNIFYMRNSPCMESKVKIPLDQTQTCKFLFLNPFNIAADIQAPYLQKNK